MEAFALEQPSLALLGPCMSQASPDADASVAKENSGAERLPGAARAAFTR